MDILSMIDNYKELLDRKDELEELTTENNKAITEARDALSKVMIDAEMPKVSRNGFVYSLQDKVKYSKKGGDSEAFLEFLEDEGLGDIIKRTVNAQTLSSTIKAVAEDNDGELPEGYDEFINTYQYYDISKRKETNKTAAKAKKAKEA